MIRFCRSGTSAVPISTPRSPRATMTASDSARISSRAAIASAFSILAITCAVEPRASISVRSARTSEAERTNESATKSTSSSIANSRSSRSLRVIDGIGSGTPGRLTPLWEETTPPTITVAARPATLDRLDPEPDVAVVDQHVVADLEHRAEDGGADREVAVLHGVLAGDHEGRAALERDRRRRGHRRGASAPGGRRSARSAGRRAPRPRARGLRACGGRRGCRATC